jgi:hypothetical protein
MARLTPSNARSIAAALPNPWLEAQTIAFLFISFKSIFKNISFVSNYCNN